MQAYSPSAPHVTVGLPNVGLKPSQSLPSLTRYVSEFPATRKVGMKLIPILLMAVASPYQRPDSIVISRLSFPARFLES